MRSFLMLALVLVAAGGCSDTDSLTSTAQSGGALMACSVPNDTNVSASASLITIGDSVTITHSFGDDGSASSCDQVLGLAMVLVAGSPQSPPGPSIAPASPDTDYAREWTPTTVGLWTLWANVVYDPVDGWPGGFLVFPAETEPPFAGDIEVIQVRVLSQREATAEGTARDATGGIGETTATSHAGATAATAGATDRAATAEGEELE